MILYLPNVLGVLTGVLTRRNVLYMTTTYTTTDAGTITLGRTEYRVEIQTNEAGEVMNTWLHGPRGAAYFLRGFMGEDTGRRQVISWKSGQPLRVRGNEVRVNILGGIIEVAA